MAQEKITIRVALQNANAAAREAYRTSKAFRDTTKATQGLNKELERTHHRSFLFNQTMFTARRVLFGFTIGATAAAGALALMGIKFNTTMEMSEIGMGFLLKSASKAKVEMAALLQISKDTIYDLPHISEAGRRLLGMGFDVAQTNTYLMAMSENLAAMNQPVETMDRIITAFGQIRARGKLAGQEMLQLVNAQVPVYQILRDELGLTSKQISNIADANISAEVGLAALTRGMVERFGGANKALLNSVSGQWQKFKENTEIIMGAIMMAPFKAIKENFPGLLKTMDAMTTAMTRRGGGFFAMVAALDEGAHAGGRINETLRRLHRFGTQLAEFFETGLGPALINFGKAVMVASIPVLFLIGGILELLTHIPYLHVLLTMMIIAWTAHKIVLIKNYYWERKNQGIIIKGISLIKAKIIQLHKWAFAEKLIVGRNMYSNAIHGVTTRQMKHNTVLARGVRNMFAMAAMTKKAARATLAFTLAMLKQLPVLIWTAIRHPKTAAKAIWGMTKAIWAAIFSTKTWTTAFHFLKVAIFSIPLFGWVLLAISALVLLEMKWGVVTKAIQFFWSVLKKVFNWIKNTRLFKLIGGIVGGAAKVLGAAGGLVGLANGGTVTQAGSFMVGERGKEIVTLPRGASVTPITASGMSMAGAAGGGMNITIMPQAINLDGRTVAEVVWKHKLDKFARR